jgi:TRAP-type C4-dicarboxylate transport system permease small subunit
MKILKWLDEHVEEAILTVALLILVTLTSVNVILRYVFNSGLVWSDEICKYCLIYSGFFSIGYWVKHGTGIKVDALVQILPKSVQKVLYVVTQGIMLVFFCIATKAAFSQMMKIKATNQVSGTLQISMVWVYIAPTLGFAWAVFRILQGLYRQLKSNQPAAETKGA